MDAERDKELRSDGEQETAHVGGGALHQRVLPPLPRHSRRNPVLMSFPTAINLHRATAAHVRAIANLRADANGHASPSKPDIDLVKRSIAAPGQLWLVAQRGSEVVGYAAAVPISPVLYELDDIHLDRRFRSGGIGTALISDIFRLLQEQGVSAVAIPAHARLRDALGRLGVQMLPEGQALGLASADGGFYAVSGRNGRTHMGVGFLPQLTRAAVAWGIDADGEPTGGQVAESFVASFSGARRQEAVDTIGDRDIIGALITLSRIDLVEAWTAPFASSAQ